jgi:hypothetical protein
MKPPFVLALVLVLVAREKVAAQSIDLAHFGLGPIAPFSLELDGNPATPEFGAITPLGLWVINPATYCKSLVNAPMSYEEATTAGTFYVGYVQRVTGRDYMLYIDIDPADGRLPIVAQKIESGCYPASLGPAAR